MRQAGCTLIFWLTMSLFSFQVSAASVEEILEEAFESQTGNVTAPVDGHITDMARRTAPNRGDLMVEIRTTKNLDEKDCRHFLVTMKNMNVRGSKSEPVTVPSIEISYCKDGRFPKEEGGAEAGKKKVEELNAYARERAARMPAIHPQAK